MSAPRLTDEQIMELYRSMHQLDSSDVFALGCNALTQGYAFLRAVDRVWEQIQRDRWPK